MPNSNSTRLNRANKTMGGAVFSGSTYTGTDNEHDQRDCVELRFYRGTDCIRMVRVLQRVNGVVHCDPIWSVDVRIPSDVSGSWWSL
jgi:hypothetical protein